VLLSDTVPEKALLIAKLKADPAYAEERDRVAAFRELGGGGQTTYYKWAKRIRSPADVSQLRVHLSNARQPPPALRLVGGSE
jgi:hypothetical protein